MATLVDIDGVKTRYFKLDTRDRSFTAQTYYAAWRPNCAALFLIDDNGKATVMFILDLVNVAGLRGVVQQGITDVVGCEEISRPEFSDVDFSQVSDRSDINATQLGTLLEV